VSGTFAIGVRASLQLTAFFARPEMTRLLQKLTGGYGFESAAEAARILLARYDVNGDGKLDKTEAAALKAGGFPT
jgi:hypothetical protein